MQSRLTYRKNYAVDIALTPLPALTSSDAVGTIGMVGGLPAIVLNSTTAVALMNVGALCPEHYGTYHPFTNLPSLSNGWYVPTRTELEALAGISSAWGAPYGVNGRTFTVIEGKTLFLPAAGLDDTDDDPHDFINVSTFGYYWSSTVSETLPICLSFSSSVVNIISDYPSDALTVRPFHALSAQ